MWKNYNYIIYKNYNYIYRPSRFSSKTNWKSFKSKIATEVPISWQYWLAEHNAAFSIITKENKTKKCTLIRIEPTTITFRFRYNVISFITIYQTTSETIIFFGDKLYRLIYTSHNLYLYIALTWTLENKRVN